MEAGTKTTTASTVAMRDFGGDAKGSQCLVDLFNNWILTFMLTFFGKFPVVHGMMSMHLTVSLAAVQL
jgi:hypothetical protein